MVDVCDVDGDAMHLYSMAGCDPEQPPGIGQLIRVLLGTAVKVAPLRSNAELVRVGSLWHVYVRRGTPPARMRFYAGHELAHWYYRQTGYDAQDIEERCDALSAAIVAPRPYFNRVRSRGSLQQVADAIGVTQSLVALRMGEVTGMPSALVIRKARIIVRGDEWGWSDARSLQHVAQHGHPSLKKTVLTDEPGRVALFAS